MEKIRKIRQMKNKYQKKKKKKMTNHGVTVLLQIIKNQSKYKIQNGPLWPNNMRKNIQRPLIEDFYIGNLTNDTTAEEILATLRLDGTIYVH